MSEAYLLQSIQPKYKERPSRKAFGESFMLITQVIGQIKLEEIKLQVSLNIPFKNIRYECDQSQHYVLYRQFIQDRNFLLSLKISDKNKTNNKATKI